MNRVQCDICDEIYEGQPHHCTMCGSDEFHAYEPGCPEKRDILSHPDRYTRGSIECWDYILDQEMNYLEGNIIKYVTRYKYKNGVEDLKKARNYLDKLIETVK